VKVENWLARTDYDQQEFFLTVLKALRKEDVMPDFKKQGNPSST
jgi:hypothetical protein